MFLSLLPKLSRCCETILCNSLRIYSNLTRFYSQRISIMNLGDTLSDGWAFVIALGLLAFACFACIHEYRLEKQQAKWHSTQGFITSWKETDVVLPKKNLKRNVHETSIHVLYEYPVGDSMFTGHAHFNSSASPAWIPGGKRQLIRSDSDRIPVCVYYDPRHPRKSVLERAQFTFEWYFWPLFVLTTFYICVYSYDHFFKHLK